MQGICYLVSALLMCACGQSTAGGQTGDEGHVRSLETTPRNTNRACDYELTPVDGSTIYGATIESILSGFGAQPSQFHLTTSSTFEGEFGAQGGDRETSLQLELSLADGEITQYTELPFADQEGSSACAGVGYDVPVLLSIATADGSFAERLLGNLQVESPVYARFEGVLPLDDVRGTFRLTSTTHSWTEGKLVFQIGFWPGGSQGTVVPQFGTTSSVGGEPPTTGSTTSTDATSNEFFPFQIERARWLGKWPSAAACDTGDALPSDASLIGITVEDVVSIVSTESVSVMTDQGDVSVMQIDLSVPEEVCVGRGSRSIVVYSNAALGDEQLGLDSELVLQSIVRVNDQGDLSAIDVSRASFEEPLTGIEATNLLGFDVPSVDAYGEVYVVFGGRFVRDEGGWSGDGELAVYGANQDAGSGGAPREFLFEDGRTPYPVSADRLFLASWSR